MIGLAGGMVASFALPASAAAPIPSVKAPATVEALASPAPSAAQAPLVSPVFGDISFSGVVQPKPKPRPKPKPVVVRTPDHPSRSATRVRHSTVQVPHITRAHISRPAPVSHSGGVLGIAASLAGIYYVYGGTTTAGFDCSGFTQYVFKRVGVNLPRTAEQQRQFTTRVSSPQPGDLVFFGAPAYHVGIYAGRGQMWDSPHTGKAVSLRSIWSSAVTYGRV